MLARTRLAPYLRYGVHISYPLFSANEEKAFKPLDRLVTDVEPTFMDTWWKNIRDCLLGVGCGLSSSYQLNDR